MALNDTWVFDGRQKRWDELRPPLAPPPMFAPATALVPGGGKVLVCGYDASQVQLHQQTTSSAIQQTWIYDLAENTWPPIHGDLSPPGYRWLTASASEQHGVILLVAFGPERRTYALRYDPKAMPLDLPGAPPGTVACKYPEQKLSLEQAPAPDPAWEARLAALPANAFVDASRVDVFVRPVAPGGRWEQLRTTGTAAIGREAVYLPKHDTLLWLGGSASEGGSTSGWYRKCRADKLDSCSHNVW